MEQIVRAEERRRRGGTWILVGLVVLWVVVTALSAYLGRRQGLRSALLSVPVSKTTVQEYNGQRVYHTFIGGKVHVRTQILASETLGEALADHQEAVSVAVAGVSDSMRP